LIKKVPKKEGGKNVIYILQHNDETPAGSTLEWCQLRQRDYQIIHLVKGCAFPQSITPQDQVVICGGGMDVDEEQLYPWLKTEKKFLDTCLQKKIKILGLCLGGQLLAEALGARVSRHPHWEVGWSNVELKSPLRFFENNLEAFQWHAYSFDTPTEALQIATNNICQHQGFIYKDHAIGLQFHPEATTDWIKECADTQAYPEGPYVQSRDQIYKQLDKQKNLKIWYFALLDYFFKN
jgi:GMP synthase-like glutamine amidotransferase